MGKIGLYLLGVNQIFLRVYEALFQNLSHLGPSGSKVHSHLNFLSGRCPHGLRTTKGINVTAGHPRKALVLALASAG